MASSSSSRKPETKGRGLIDEVFSWSVRDVLNINLYRDKVSCFICIIKNSFTDDQIIVCFS